MTIHTVANRTITEHELGGYTYYSVEPLELAEVVENANERAVDEFIESEIQNYYEQGVR